MLAELMLPDGAHTRDQDWTIFFLHKDVESGGENEVLDPNGQPPLIYVLNLVITKHDKEARRCVLSVAETLWSGADYAQRGECQGDGDLYSAFIPSYLQTDPSACAGRVFQASYDRYIVGAFHGSE